MTKGKIRLIPRGDRPKVTATGHRDIWPEDIYAHLMSMSWAKLTGLIIAAHLLVNTLFAGIYLIIGDGIKNARPGSFQDAFFFSVHTMATINYGEMAPHGLAGNIVVTAESLTGLIFLAFTTGLVFSRFSRPTSRILFSKLAVVCPFEGTPHLMFRLANERRNRIVDANVHVVMWCLGTTKEGYPKRRFYDLTPVRDRVPMMTLSWTVMHKIDESSPLFGLSTEWLKEHEAEIIVSLTGTDETLSQPIHAQYSYVADELVFGSAFEDIVSRSNDGQLEINYNRFHNVKPFEKKV